MASGSVDRIYEDHDHLTIVLPSPSPSPANNCSSCEKIIFCIFVVPVYLLILFVVWLLGPMAWVEWLMQQKDNRQNNFGLKNVTDKLSRKKWFIEIIPWSFKILIYLSLLVAWCRYWALYIGIVLVGGYLVTYFITKLLVVLLKKWYSEENNKYALYYIKGSREAFHILLFSGFVLLISLLFFHSPDIKSFLTKRARYKGIHHVVEKYIIHTCLAFFVTSLLWVLKRILILTVEASHIYQRYRDKIEKEGLPCYILAFMNRKYGTLLDSDINSSSTDHTSTNNEQNHSGDDHDDNTKKYEKFIKFPKTLYSVKLKAKYFEGVAKHAKSRVEDKAALERLLDKIPKSEKPKHGCTVEYKNLKDEKLVEYLLGLGSDKKAKDLYNKLKPFFEVNGSTGEVVVITYECFETWLKKAYKKCLQLGYTLLDCRAAAKHLDIGLSIIIIYFAVFWWIIMTGNGNTKILVVMALPFTTGAFMFQEAGKNIFEGVVFTFIKHPFDVGDLCVIDGDTPLEVKRLGITTTTFRQIGGEAELMLPNSTLTGKSILNHRRSPRTNDELEISLEVNSTSAAQIKQLQDYIKRYLHEKNCNINDQNVEPVIVKMGAESFKLFVRFQHGDLSSDHMTPFEILEKKDRRRSELLLDIIGFLNDKGIKFAAPAPDPPPAPAPNTKS